MLVKTKYLGCTNNKPSRIKAIASSSPFVTISYPYAERYPFRAALAALIEKMVGDGVSLTENEKDADKWREEYFDGEYWFVSPEK
jgi:hypothetical protein